VATALENPRLADDTTCAMVGDSVALPSRQVRAAWIARRAPLPAGFERS